MPQETFRDVHVDRPLTNLSIMHFQNTSEFVAHRMFPPIPVTHNSDTFDFYPSGYFNRIHESRRPEEGIANSIGYKVTQRSYACQEHALRTFVSDKKRANVDVQRNLDMEATELVTRSLLLSREKEFADQFLQTGKWSTDWTGVAATPGSNQFLKWSDTASDPIRDIGNLKVEMLLKGKRMPNKMLITVDIWNTLRNHPDVLERIKYTGTSNAPAKAMLNSIASLFEVDEIVVMQTVLNIAIDGVEDPTTGFPPTDDIFIAENKILLIHAINSYGLMSPLAGATFLWNRYINQGLSGGPVVRRYRETPAKKGEYIEAEMAMDQRIVAPDLGALLTDVV